MLDAGIPSDRTRNDEITRGRRIRINERSLFWLREIDEFIRECDLCGERLRDHAASDVLDGYATRSELDDLIRRRLLTVIHYDDDESPPIRRELCGSTWSVDLTERAVRALWPHRMEGRS